MQPLRYARRILPFLTIAAALMLFSGLASAQDAQVTGTLNYVSGLPGAEVYRYDYTLVNVGVEPTVQTVLLFFDSDPATQAFDGSDDCDFFSASGPNADWEVTPYESPDPDAWRVEFSNYSSLGPAPGEEAATFSVQVLWKNPDTVPPAELFFEALDGWAHEGITDTRIETTAPRNSVIGGRVFGCHGEPLVGVTIDLFGNGTLVGSMLTDAAGDYSFSVWQGGYTVSIVTPLGYTLEGEVPHDTRDGQFLDFHLACQAIVDVPRTIGYWKHQANVFITGKGKAQETKVGLIAFLDNIYDHFTLQPVHPVSVYTVPPSATSLTKLSAAQDILTENRGASMNDRARQQLMALLLNVTSLKLAQTSIVSQDGISANQAITFAWDLIADGNPANDELAKTICDEINNGRKVPAGWIPAGTSVILYSRPDPSVAPAVTALNLGQNFPNPFNPTTRIPFSITSGGLDRPVRLEIFDMSGRLVRTLVDDARGGGEYQALWDGSDDSGRPAPSGIYFYRLTDGGQKETRKLHLLK